MRQLASIQRVSAIEPIEGADAVERARILGWTVVTQKGTFKPGDRCIFLEADAIVPDDLLGCAFLAPSMRVRARKIRGVLSEGVALPLETLLSTLPEGLDLTEWLRVTKWEPPAPELLVPVTTPELPPFPAFVPKTDETRVQVLQAVLERYRGRRFVATEKLDGSSMTAYWHQGRFGVCSRNRELFRGAGHFWRMAEVLGLEAKLGAWCTEHSESIAVQGELVGPGVQGNRLELPELAFYAFNVWSITKGEYMSYAYAKMVLEDLDVPTVPEVAVLELEHTSDDLVAMASGRSRLNPCVEREGLVFRPLAETWDARLGRLSFKAISPGFLLAAG